MRIFDIKNPIFVPAVTLASFVLMLLLMPRDLFAFDEGIILVDSILVLHGDIIHRDFYCMYGPGQFYIIAALFHLFGQHFMVERIYDIAVRSAGLAVLFVILRAYVSPIATLAFTAAAGCWMVQTLDAPVYPVFPCIPLSLFGTYLLVSAPRRPASIGRVAGAGATAGLSALFRYDVGFLILAAHVVFITWQTWRAVPAGDRRHYWRKALAIYMAVAALAFLPAAVLILANSALDGFIADVVSYSSKYYARMRSLPFPGPWSLRGYPALIGLYFPVVAGAATLFELFRYLSRKGPGHALEGSGEQESEMDFLIAFGVLSSVLFIKGVVRINTIHMALAIMPALVVFAIVARRWWRDGVMLRAAATVGIVFVFVPTIDGLKGQVGHSYHLHDRAFGQWLAMRIGLVPPLPKAQTACTTVPATGIAKLSPDYVRVVNYLDAHSGPDERILIGLKRHDVVPANPMVLYFAADRLPGTHWAEYDPGQQTRADVQSEMIEELKRNAVRWIVRDDNFSTRNERNDSWKSSGVELLDDYIDGNYREVAASGKTAIWLRATDPVPTEADPGDCMPQTVK